MSEAKVVTMKVYRNGPKEKSLVLHVQPGKDIVSSEYVDAEGTPLMMSLQFENGECTVPERLGQWLLDKGFADKDKRRIELTA